jgi:hypothetical protein
MSVRMITITMVILGFIQALCLALIVLRASMFSLILRWTKPRHSNPIRRLPLASLLALF